MLRRVMEKTASFLGYEQFRPTASSRTTMTRTRRLHKRVINLMSHGDYSLYEPREMMEENKDATSARC